MPTVLVIGPTVTQNLLVETHPKYRSANKLSTMRQCKQSGCHDDDDDHKSVDNTAAPAALSFLALVLLMT